MASSNDTAKTYYAIVLGSGQAGTPLAQTLAQSGYHAALIGGAHIGGTCINEGCAPTKTVISSARAAWVISNSEKMGVHHRGKGHGHRSTDPCV